jgi:hypothetical protein
MQVMRENLLFQKGDIDGNRLILLHAGSESGFLDTQSSESKWRLSRIDERN